MHCNPPCISLQKGYQLSIISKQTSDLNIFAIIKFKIY
ncbi:unknown protein [Parachlamydia acanthamoebae UV-7]|uniref:Uncharacterized protein n=1 Tax=Parachlamydia acanthamoebae (strain UV7) TaxID=765952 RepID=F8KZH5_PARAV|nr:unknown protein [Parachlamydia acanthamoebae UV-7]